MPSRYSSEATRGDAQRLAESLGIDFREIAIEPMVEAFTGALAPSFAGREPDLTEENLQARIRGTLLMALSNKFGWLVIATGNKSELSVGYSTLYGDLAGGFALIKDVYKTDVFRLARRLNERAGRELIPRSIIDRAPSAELRADQLDEDSLPPYPKLDQVLEAYVELDRSREELVAGRLRPGRRRARARDDRPRRVQAPPGAARREAAAEGLRPRPPHADHEPLARLSLRASRCKHDAEDRQRERQREADPADDDERRPRRLPPALADLGLQARAVDEVVQVRRRRAARRERDLHPEHGLERRAVDSQSRARERDARQRRDEQRAVAERAPAQAELLHRPAARLALERADRRHAGEDERDRAADPDRRRRADGR